MATNGINGGIDLNGIDTTGVDLDLMLADLDVSDDEGVIEAVTDVQEEIVEEPDVEELVVNEDNGDEIAQAMSEVEEAGAAEEAAEAATDDGQTEENAWAGDADQGDAEITTIEAAPETTEQDEDVHEALGNAIDLEEQRDAIYAEQPADDTSLEVPAPTASKKARAASTGVPRARTAVSDLPEDAFVLTTDIPADLAVNKAAVLVSCPAQKKVREKFENLLVSIAGNRAPSTYTAICFKALLGMGEVTGAQLTAALTSSGLGEGTARSQSGQLMALFPAVKIATRDGNKLTLNPDSVLADALKGILSL